MIEPAALRDLEWGQHFLIHDLLDHDNPWAFARLAAPVLLKRSSALSAGMMIYRVGWDGGTEYADRGRYQYTETNYERYYPVPPEQVDAIVMAAVHMEYPKWCAFVERIVST